MEFMPETLPSYYGLPKAQQESVKFTQCKMDYNMGWLVQVMPPMSFNSYKWQRGQLCCTVSNCSKVSRPDAEDVIQRLVVTT
eukprot:6229899-Amphidinium_carterae.1